jgi:hypothetical protein
MLNGDEGEVDAPAGRPVITRFTKPLNPFCPAADTVKLAPELPAAVAIVAGDKPMVKSLVADVS